MWSLRQQSDSDMWYGFLILNGRHASHQGVARNYHMGGLIIIAEMLS